MQKIGEHLDSGDDTSICAAPVTGALRFLPCGGVRSAGHLPSCLAEAWSMGPRPGNWRPGLACQPKSLSLSPSPGLASQVLITVPQVSLPCQAHSHARCPLPLLLQPNLKLLQRHHLSCNLPFNCIKSPLTVRVLASLASLCASAFRSQHRGSQLSQISEMSLLCIAVCPAVIPGRDGWERSLSRSLARTLWWIKGAKPSSHPLHGIPSSIKCH